MTIPVESNNKNDPLLFPFGDQNRGCIRIFIKSPNGSDTRHLGEKIIKTIIKISFKARAVYTRRTLEIFLVEKLRKVYI